MDVHLDEGLEEADVDRWVQPACVLCSNGCGCDIAVKDGRMVGVRGCEGDSVNHGRLGPQGLYGSTPWASSPDRLTRPLRDRELLAIAQHCRAETARQLSWLDTRIKTAAPQALIVAP